MPEISKNIVIEDAEFVLHKMSREHMPQIVLIDQQSAHSPWTRRQFESELENSFSSFYVVSSQELIGGFAVIWQAADEIQIANIAVAAELQRKGLATWMLSTLFEQAKAKGVVSAHLEVRRSNTKAICFYKRLGFKTIGVRKNYYRAPQEDAWLMSAQLA